MTQALQEIVARYTYELAPISTGAEPRLSFLPDIKAILFDIYGTLLISGSGDVGTDAALPTQEAMIAACRAGNLTLSQSAASHAALLLKEQIENHHKIRREEGCDFPEVEIRTVWRELIARLCNEELLKVDVDDTIISQIATAYECLVNPVWPMPGAKEVLKRLAPLVTSIGVVSNAQFYTPIILSWFFGDDCPILSGPCSWSFEAGESKPSIEVFKPVLNELEQRYGISPESVLYVGNDMRNDIWTASRVGCRTCLFAGDKRSLRLRKDDDEVKEVVPDGVITELGQLTGMVVR